MRRFVMAAAALAALWPGSALAVLNVEEVDLLVLQNRFAGVPQGWTFEVEILGVDMNTATITPPGGSPIALSGDTTERYFESSSFASLVDLQMSYPPSNASQKYVITLNGVTTLTFDFAPVAPDGFGAFTSPTHESATADTTPTFTFTNACTNCNAQVVFVEDTGFSTIDIQNFVLGPPFPSMLELSDFENDDGPPVTELPFDDYEACISTAVGTIDGLVSMGGQNFGLIRAGVAEDCIEFTVPEPGSGALGAAVLATLAVLRRRRTGRPGARIP